MLVLTRKIGERIVIGENITLVVGKVTGNRVSLAIEAPPEVHIVRGELARMIQEFAAREEDAQPTPLASVARSA